MTANSFQNHGLQSDWPRQLTIAGVEYCLVRERRDKVAVYQGPDAYMRIGSASILGREIALQKILNQAKAPVPLVLKEGVTDNGQLWFTESVIPGELLGQIFCNEWKTNRRVSDESFQRMLQLAKAWTSAQLTTTNSAPALDLEGLFQHQHLSHLAHLANLDDRSFDNLVSKLKIDLAKTANVVTSFDLGTFNVFGAGVIDLETAGYGPLGYDPLSLITGFFWYPRGEASQIGQPGIRPFEFSEEQIASYIHELREFFPIDQTERNAVVGAMLTLRCAWRYYREKNDTKLSDWRVKVANTVLSAYTNSTDPILALRGL